MPGRGPEPKDPDQQANKSRAAKAKAQLRVVTAETSAAPPLPEFMPDGEDWPDQTRKWWHSWINNPLTEDYRESDWQDLLDCACIHGRLWCGDYKAASELRLRMARHGATREDRARLRIVFASADQAEMRSKTGPRMSGESSRERRGGLRKEA